MTVSSSLFQRYAVYYLLVNFENHLFISAWLSYNKSTQTTEMFSVKFGAVDTRGILLIQFNLHLVCLILCVTSLKGLGSKLYVHGRSASARTFIKLNTSLGYFL
jgi:hypothetical protein